MSSNEFLAPLPFYSGIISALIIGFLIYKTLKLKSVSGAMNPIANITALILFSGFIMNIFLVIGHLNEISSIFNNVNEEAAYAIGYTFYFIFWVIGNQKFLKSIIRLPEHRRASFNRINKILNLQLFLALCLSVITSGFIPSIRNSPNYLDLVEGSFAILSQIAVLSFIYFYKALGTERDKNASKLLKARLELLRYSIKTQIIMSIAMLIGAVALVLDRYDGFLVEFLLFTTISILTLIFCIIVYLSITIPNRVRIAYNIAPKRFQFIAPTKN